jgi:transposase-like protein
MRCWNLPRCLIRFREDDPLILANMSNGTSYSSAYNPLMKAPTPAQCKWSNRAWLFDSRLLTQLCRKLTILCVRWYLSYKLSSRDLVNMVGERGIELAHTTILRWVQRYVPEFEKRWSRYARTVGGSWRCDETYIKVKGRWTYLYRAVDKQGRTVDFLLTAKRDVAATKRFFQKAMNGNGAPRVITLDAYAASHRAVREMKAEGKMPKRVRVRSSKYLNNGIEQDHRRVKQRIRPMLGFKRFHTAAVTISGIELAAKIRKHQFKVGKLPGRPTTIPAIWAAVVGA